MSNGNQSNALHFKLSDWFLYDRNIDLNPFQSSVAFHIETSHSTCTANQMTGFYMKCNTGLKCIEQLNK